MAHEKVYAFCEDMCKEETMTKSQIYNELGNCVDISQIALVEGEITVPAANSGTLTGTVRLNYPEGFNYWNSMVIGLMANKDSADVPYFSTSSELAASGSVIGTSGLRATLKEDCISVSIIKPDEIAPGWTSSVRVLLYKVC